MWNSWLYWQQKCTALFNQRVEAPRISWLRFGWNLQEVNARGGHVVVFTDSKEDITAEKVLRIETELEALTPMLLNVMQQLLAYYIAVERGNDVDQPRNLAKSVTVE